MRGFVSGIIWGVAVIGVGLAALSLMAPLAPRPDVGSAAPEGAVPAAAPGASGVEVSGADPDVVETAPGAPRGADRAADDLAALAESDTTPPAAPDVTGAPGAPRVPGGAQEVTAPDSETRAAMQRETAAPAAPGPTGGAALPEAAGEPAAVPEVADAVPGSRAPAAAEDAGTVAAGLSDPVNMPAPGAAPAAPAEGDDVPAADETGARPVAEDSAAAAPAGATIEAQPEVPAMAGSTPEGTPEGTPPAGTAQPAGDTAPEVSVEPAPAPEPEAVEEAAPAGLPPAGRAAVPAAEPAPEAAEAPADLPEPPPAAEPEVAPGAPAPAPAGAPAPGAEPAPVAEPAPEVAEAPAGSPVPAAGTAPAAMPAPDVAAAPQDPAAPEAGAAAVVVPRTEPSAPLPVIVAAPEAGEAAEPPADEDSGLPQAGTEIVELAPRIGQRVVPLTERESAAAPAPEADSPAEAAPDAASLPPLERYAEPYADDGAKPMMAIVLIDDAESIGVEALKDFPYPLTFALDPAAPGAAEKMARHRAAGFEVVALVDLPKAAAAQDAEVALAASFARLDQAVGLLEGTRSGIQGNRSLSDQVIAYAGGTGHGLITQGNGLNTALKLALRSGVPAAAVFRDFDGAGQTPTVMRRFLDQAAFRAGQEGAVVMMGRVRPDTISALLLWGLQDRASRVALVPVSAVLKASAAAE